MAIEKRQFLFGMDQDSDDRYIQPGFTRKNVNVRVGSSVSDGNGTGENISGNTLIPNLDLPAGDNKVIGSYWYKKKDLNYFFVWNENGDHGIYEYNHVSSHISTVMIAEVLGFSKDGLITGINVVEFDDDNDLLYWSALSINPSKINIQKAKSGGYTLPIKKEIIDAIKYPPLCPIEAHYEVDVNQKVNYLEDKIVQVKARYIYDDKEKSAFSPISVNILPISSCSGNSSGNTIRIIVPPGGELVERIEIAARFSNISSFYKIVDQPLGDYIVNTTTGNYEYIFNNDAKYDIVSQAESDNLFDRIPQIAGAQEFIAGNRIAYGDITENYDNVPIEVNLDVKYQPKASSKTNTISGEVTIRNSYESGDYQNFQPIHDNGSGIVFGGFNKYTYERNIYDYNQSLPLGGFVIYLAGTDYFAVSEQIKGINSNLQNNPGNAYDSDKSSKRSSIRDEIEGASVGPFPSTRTYSTWSIPNVPDGTYVLRVASHLTTQADLDSGTRDYQKTSTYLYQIDGAFVQEKVITVLNGQIVNNVHVVIGDLTDPSALKESSSLAGYIVDPAYQPNTKNRVPVTSISQLLSEKRIDSSYVTLRTSDYNYTFARTDHNGFFYAAYNFSSNTSQALLLESFDSGQYSESSFESYDIKSTGTPANVVLQATENNKTGVFANTENNITDYSRTNITYTIKTPSGAGLNNAYCVLTNGDVQQTDSSGDVVFTAYADTSGSKDRRDDTFYFYPNNINCITSFLPDHLDLNIFISKTTNNDSTTPIILQDVLATLLNNTSASYLKRGASYDYGLLYFDRANRSGQVNVSSSSNLLIPFYTEQTGSPAVAIPDSAPLVEWEIKHAPPSWATHYQWVRTKNTFSNRYIQWAAKDVSYLDDAGNPDNFNDGTQIAIDITNLSSDYISAHPDSVLSYDYSPGDRIRFIKDSNGNLFTDYFDIKITSFAAGILTMEKLNALPLLSEGCLFEIYSPKLELDEDIYYEIGECFEVQETILNGKKYYSHKGLISANDQSPFALAANPATGTFRSGDTFYRGRTIPVTSGRKNYTIDSSRFSDFFESSVSDIGRPALEDQDASSAHRPTTIYYTQRFIPETNINGLNTVYSSSFETYDRNNGAIRKLFSINNRLDCYQELKVSKILVQENVVYDQFDKGTVGVSESVLSNPSVPYQGEYGTMNPESFAEEGGRRYFFDVRNGAVLRLSNDGLTTISDKQMHSYFESKSNFYSSFDQIPEIWGVFDENHDEYVLNFGSISRDKGFSPQDLALVSSQAEVVTETRNGLQYSFVIGYSENDDGVPTQFEIIRDVSNGTYVINSSAGSIDMDRQKILTIPSETVAFSERTGYWDSFYSYLPECMCRVGIDFLSFKKGKAFLHNSNNLRNNFYGVRFPSELWVVFNQAPSNNKVFNSLGVESTTIWEAREILTDSGQKSQLIESDFQDDQGQGLIFDAKENIHYAALMQDENTPNVQFPLINGDDMRDVSILFKLTKDTDDLERIFSANINFALSQRSNK
tara:strand:- start:5502 stop:10019 length:4518 start_codon:yes stop_codon:yes gene_type:complete